MVAPLEREIEVVPAEGIVLCDPDRWDAACTQVLDLLGRAEVVSGREVLAVPPDDNDADLLVVLRSVERLIELVQKPPALRIAVASAVEGDEGNPAVDVVAYVSSVHHFLRHRSRRVGLDGLAGLGLQRDELLVQATLGHQLLVAAFLGDASLLEDDDPIRVSDRRQAVRDHEDGAPAT